MSYETDCRQCGRLVTVLNARYCEECRWEHRTCEHCKAPFRVNRTNQRSYRNNPLRATKHQRFCSRACWVASGAPRVHAGVPKGALVLLDCRNCGTGIALSPGRAKGRRYCSMTCRRAWEVRS